MKKKSVVMILGIVVVALLVLVGCETEDDVVNEDALRFKAEHEDLNGTPHPDRSEFILSDMYVSEDNPFRFVEFDEIIELLEDGTGVVYFGFPICPWCRNLVPVLIDAASDFGVEEILYRDVLADRNLLSLADDGEIVEDRAGHPGYYQVLEILGDLVPVWEVLEDDSIRRIFVPAIVFVRDGQVISYFENLPTFHERVNAEDDPVYAAFNFSMNEDEIDELTQIFIAYFERVFGN